MSTKPKQQKQQIKPRIFIAGQIALIYFILLVVLVRWTTHFKIALVDDGNPTLWFSALLNYYYFLPFVLAFIFGFAFRPLWINFRNLIVLIFTVHAVWSVTVFSIRYRYIEKMEDELHRASMSEVKAGEFTHTTFDQDSDGLVDKIDFLGLIEMEGLPEGDYQFAITFSQQGEDIPGARIISSPQHIKEAKALNLPVSFNAQKYVNYFSEDIWSLNIQLRKVLKVDEKGQKIKELCRWMPFLHSTSWEGDDPDIRDQVIDLHYLPSVHSFFLLPVQL